jgi:type VI protein secretion system component VasF
MVADWASLLLWLRPCASLRRAKGMTANNDAQMTIEGDFACDSASPVEFLEAQSGIANPQVRPPQTACDVARAQAARRLAHWHSGNFAALASALRMAYWTSSRSRSTLSRGSAKLHSCDSHRRRGPGSPFAEVRQGRRPQPRGGSNGTSSAARPQVASALIAMAAAAAAATPLILGLVALIRGRPEDFPEILRALLRRRRR